MAELCGESELCSIFYDPDCWVVAQSDCAVSSKQDHFYMSRTELRAQAAVYLEHDLYTRDHFSMSRTELRAQAAVSIMHEERDKKTTRARGDW